MIINVHLDINGHVFEFGRRRNKIMSRLLGGFFDTIGVANNNVISEGDEN